MKPKAGLLLNVVLRIRPLTFINKGYAPGLKTLLNIILFKLAIVNTFLIYICLPRLNTTLHEKGKSNQSTSIVLTIIMVVALLVYGLPNMDSMPMIVIVYVTWSD